MLGVLSLIITTLLRFFIKLEKAAMSHGMTWNLLTEMSPDYLLFQKTAFKILLLHNSIESICIVLLRDIIDHW